MTTSTILWRRVDRPGHEAAQLVPYNDSWILSGSAIFLQDGMPCQLSYHIVCDGTWRTKLAIVTGWLGSQFIKVDVEPEFGIFAQNQQNRWMLNKNEVAAVAGCIDIDLNFSPSTNLLPIRRLNLAVGQEAVVKAAWLRFPSFQLEPLEQLYRRTSKTTYRYESAGGKFVRDLVVNEAGFVTSYPGIWEPETGI